MSGPSRSRSLVVMSALTAAVTLGPMGSAAGQAAACVPVGAWVAPLGAKTLRGEGVLAAAAKRAVVLLGETHDSAEHHRWQLHAIAALHVLRPNMVLGFETFPRRVQPALDRWVAGELTEAEFLAQSDWRNVWRLEPQLYLPLFHFARMHRIPMIALNVESSLTRDVSRKGLDAIPSERREGVGRPAAATEAYVDSLFPVYAEHDRPGGRPAERDRNDPQFRRFVESQQVWDRAMAEALAAAAKRPGAPLAVGVMGSRHIVHGHGVPHQLKDLGETEVATLVPWDRGDDCKDLVAGYADAVFGLAAPVAAADARPRLGVHLEQAADGVRIRQVEKGSIAEASGVRDGDVVLEIAGRPAKQAGDVAGAVRRQAPGTWLPLKVKRGSDTVELVAKFPPQPE